MIIETVDDYYNMRNVAMCDNAAFLFQESGGGSPIKFSCFNAEEVEWIKNWFSECIGKVSWFQVNVKLMVIYEERNCHNVLVIEVCSMQAQDFSREVLKPIFIDNTKDNGERKYYFHPNPNLLDGIDLLEDVIIY